MRQHKKELIALKACGLRKGGRPAKVDTKVAKIKDEKVYLNKGQSKLFRDLLSVTQ